MESLTGWLRRALTVRREVPPKATRKVRIEEVPPSARLVAFLALALAAILSLTAIQLAHIVALGRWNGEVFNALVGLIGTVTGVFVGARSR